MKKQKITCHICYNVTKTPQGEAPPTNCALCIADLQNPSSETRKHETVVEKGAGGVMATAVQVMLTDTRLIFIGIDGSGGTAGAMGGLLGGAIAGAIAGARSSRTKFNAVLLADIASINERVFGLLKNRFELTIQTKNGGSFSFELTKKEMEKWRPDLFKFSA